ncbi:low molecular weight protein-tyrosine-phosphatase [Aliarcobacter lanthieri]|uniref:low molecular weight protein-tyrosine-phosphatase n=1 Tax=Aliarcobacter lanthieri TaxID=1355374 RepID=UPI00047A046E|nr:low molecular weight protein-tyrosine-phosphatase [Aliarcobacter lanthieri]QKF58742.1 low molecular weight protein-tyrosine-phosphatase [Aliarcobacter lanthieri]
MSKSILFVCLGNICRSPLAHGIAQDYINKNKLDIIVDSAGTGSWHIGEAPCENSIKVAHLNGVNISKQRARQVKKDDFKNFDFIVALDDNNLRDLKNLGYANPLKLGDYGYEGDCVPDPYYFKNFEDFKNVYSMIEKCVINLIKVTI